MNLSEDTNFFKSRKRKRNLFARTSRWEQKKDLFQNLFFGETKIIIKELYISLMKKECLSASGKNCSFNQPSLLPFLVRIVVGILFLTMGFNKLSSPDMFQGLLASKLGLSGTMGMLAYWLVVVFEGLGGLAVFLGKLVPKIVYRISLFAQFVIVLVAYFSVYGALDGQFWYHLLLAVSLLGLLFAVPRCPLGITGYSGEGCEKKK
jgi:uncharacterized membrane protein YphA (DoxX/SURF4 family)